MKPFLLFLGLILLTACGGGGSTDQPASLTTQPTGTQQADLIWESPTGIMRGKTDGTDKTLLVDNADFFRLVGTSVFYTVPSGGVGELQTNGTHTNFVPFQLHVNVHDVVGLWIIFRSFDPSTSADVVAGVKRDGTSGVPNGI
jgi:hypothetical protein